MSDHGAIPAGGDAPLNQVLLDLWNGQTGIAYGPGPQSEVLDVLFVPVEILAQEG
ncbi:hypothetical protein [Actinacidiphila sp. ITFR-21]|uniref:hypothetical protein n=1 Tax=Actinacidiphila sp. ITFR-21 TaxID=3075199 RepID=UPI002889BD7A|nr:hypothetical protein [Streptomyces sp. ITFR-21]WNI20399.1 hypothetical protein RLT57_32875 [Streptomyces sp. ITFR-21]